MFSTFATSFATVCVQAAFVAEQAAQCGYCTNGMVMTTVGLLAAQPNASLDDAKTYEIVAQASASLALPRNGARDLILRHQLCRYETFTEWH